MRRLSPSREPTPWGRGADPSHNVLEVRTDCTPAEPQALRPPPLLSLGDAVRTQRSAAGAADDRAG